jgi:hypothetical protein
VSKAARKAAFVFIVLSFCNFEQIMSMETSDLIMNRVEASGLVTLDLEQFYPKDAIKVFDLKNYLFRGLIVKEKDFREALKNTNWNEFENSDVAVICSTDAIIPVWAYMLLATYLRPVAKNIVLGDKEKLVETILLNNINAIDTNEYVDKRVVVKGCGDVKIPDSAYLTITAMLQPFVKSIMYGEPCSTVPVYKKK